MARVLIALAVILPAAASAIETVGMVGDGRYLCASDNQAPLAADAPTGVSFVDLSVAGMADFTWSTSSVPALGDDALMNYDQTKYAVSWLGTPATLGAGKAFQIDSNGLVTLQDEMVLGINSYSLEYAMPNASGQPKGVIAPLWMDLTVCGVSSKVYVRQEGTAANPIRTIIEWANFGHWTPGGYGVPGQDSCASGQVTFELIWDHTQPRADIVFPNGFTLPAGVAYNPGPPPVSGQGVDSGVEIGGSDIGEIFGVDYRFVPGGGSGNGAGLSLPAGLVVRLVECDGPAISVLPAVPRVDEGSTLALTGSATAYSDFGVGSNWRWTASAGSLSGATTATPTLSAVGITGATASINVTVTVNDGKGRDGTKVFAVPVRNVAPQISAVNAAASGGGPPMEASPVTFTASFTDPGGLSTHPGGDGPFTYLWAFDDGTTSAFATPTKGFADSGSHPVNLTITDYYGAASAVFNFPLTVLNVPPTLTSFSAGVSTANEGQSITFTAAANDPSPVDQAAGFTWTFDFGDPTDPGNVVVGTAAQVNHTYRRPGSFTPSVVATDKDGGSSNPYFLSLPISVNNVAPTVTVDCPAAVDVNVVATCTCQIVDPGSALETYSVSWDFGDGTQGAGNPVQHAWTSGGTKTVSCTADDGGPNGKGTGQKAVDVSAGPGVPLPLSPAQGDVVAILAPTLVAQNANSALPPTYGFEVYADAALSQRVASTAGVLQGASTTSWSVNPPLADGKVYYWRAQAFDGTLFSVWSNAVAFGVSLVNHKPTAPAILSPPDNGTASSTTPLLKITNSTDPDPFERLSYELEVYGDAGLTTRVANGSGVAQDPSGVTGWPVPAAQALAESQHYWWRARATDHGGLASDWSAVATFHVVTTNHPPPAPAIVSPADRDRVAAYSVALAATTVVDPDGDAVAYEIALDSSDRFDATSPDLQQSGPFSASGAQAAWTPPQPLKENTRYWWRVRASDGQAASAWTMASFFVNVTNEPPTAPAIVSPADGDVTSEVRPTLTANPAFDPDEDPLTYRYELALPDDPVQVIASQAGVDPGATTVTWQPADPLARNQRYRWRVGADDNAGSPTTWSAWATFKLISTAKPVAVTLSAKPSTAREGETVVLRVIVANVGLTDVADARLTFAGTDGLDLDFGSIQVDGRSTAAGAGSLVPLGPLATSPGGNGAGKPVVVTVNGKVTSAATTLGVASALAKIVNPAGDPLSDIARTDIAADKKALKGCGCGGDGGLGAILFAIWVAALAKRRSSQ